MSKIHGVAGEWARVQGAVLGLWPLALGLFVCGFSLSVWIFASAALGASLFALSLAWMAYAYARGLKHVESFHKGALGEEIVAGILGGIGDGYHVFNDYAVNRMHVDHVVVGPAGVFAIETKFWRGSVTMEERHILVDGRLPSRDPIDQARREAASVKAMLRDLGWNGDVTPVVAFASDTFVHHTAELNGTVVMNACELAEAFGTKRMVMPPDEIDRIVTLMENNQR